MLNQMQLPGIYHFPRVINSAVPVFISLWLDFFQLQFPLVCCLLLLDDRQDRTTPFSSVDLEGETL